MFDRVRRRIASVSVILAIGALLTVTMFVRVPVAVLADIVRGRLRLPIVRLLIVLWCWCWIELAGVVRSIGLWVRGRAGDEREHYRLMGWWSGALINVLRSVLGIEPTIENADALVGGNAVVLLRHVSFADSPLSGWVFSNQHPMRPRCVLKKELLRRPVSRHRRQSTAQPLPRP